VCECMCMCAVCVCVCACVCACVCCVRVCFVSCGIDMYVVMFSGYRVV